MVSADKLLLRLRDVLARFLNRREHAFKESIARGKEVRQYAEKLQAIAALRVQLQASEHWGLTAHIMWIHAMRAQIMLLLPYQFHRSQAQLKYRKRITALLTWCDDQYQQNLFNQQPKINSI